MERLKLYKKLKEAGFPQGGAGIYLADPDTGQTYYVPQPSEAYAQFVADPGDWSELVDAMVEVWIKKNGHETS